MGDAIPVKDFLLFLGSNAIVLVQKVKKGALRLFQGRIGTRLEISQVRENTLLELLGVFDGASEGLESKREASNNIGAGDMEEVVPQHARHILARGQQKPANVLIWLPINGGGDEKVFHCKSYSCQ